MGISKAVKLGIGVSLPVAAMMFASAPAASAMPTMPCSTPGQGVDRVGTPGDETINVDVPTGQAVVVCAGEGTDTININSVGDARNTGTALWIALGRGAKTINWNVQGTSQNVWASQAIVVRPETGTSLTLNNQSNQYGWAFRCGTNREYIASANATEGFSHRFLFIPYQPTNGVYGSCL